ncbi:hydrogenase maturation factor [Blautia glucerasea]|uniref:AIR synthase-related protein n=1 Tax=Blautia glucerasea TaxID=536633 RepID=UPI001D02076A|nr:AIR synthase-related protein [Blautia glucerasea]MCB5388802.1 hydrogenase maturation factor [Blautia glucerasea]MCB5423149.1 hydrogenase maturation factor [Blautia luti]
MRLGQAAMEALQAEICGLLTPGNELVVAGAVALEGTVQIAKMKHDILREHFSESFLRNAGELRAVYGTVGENDDSCVLPENKEDCCGEQLAAGGKRSAPIIEKVEGCAAWKAAEAAGATALYVMGEGGFLSALWKMAEASQVGLEMDFTKVPIRQETIEICEIFDINPYKLNARGAILIGIPAGEALVQELHRQGMMAAVIGQTNDGNDRMLYYNGKGRYLERPAKDEIYKVLCEK